MKGIDALADRFVHAFYRKEWRGDEVELADLSIENAYAVQQRVAEKRIAKGERVSGYKVGCTSKAIRKQFGLTEPINGRLFHPHIFEDGVELDWSRYLNCAIEPEMVLKIGKELKGGDLSDDELIDAIEFVSPGIEVHEFHFWHSPTTIQELICSGGIHTGLVIGKPQVPAKTLTFETETFRVHQDGTQVCSAPAKEIMGGPLHSLRWLVGFLTDRGLLLEKGSLVIPGSPTELVSIGKNMDLKVVIDNVGEVNTFFRS